MTETLTEDVRKAVGQARLALAGYVSPESAIDMIDRLGDLSAQRADLSRPAPAEGAVREAALREAAGIAYRMPAYVDNFNETDSMGRMLPGSPYDRGRYDASNEILAALSPPEDATPAAPVSVEEAGREAVEVAEWAIDVLAICEDPDWRDDEDRMEAMRSAYLESRVSQKHTLQRAKDALAQQDRRAALREMQSIREEMEGESGE